MFREPASIAPDDLKAGMTAEFERAIEEQDILEFARNSGDANPLHVDAEYARGTAYGARLVHGAFQVGLASAMIGMYLPGRYVLLGSVTARFLAPLYFPCRVQVHGEVTSWNVANLSGNVKVTIRDASTQVPSSEVSMGFTFHEQARPAQPAREIRGATAESTRPAVLVTGAGGGIGQALVADLAANYPVIAMVRRTRLPDGLRSCGEIYEWQADLQDAGWEEELDRLLRGRKLQGIVHAAWPGAAQGGLLQASDAVVGQQLEFGTRHLIRLARFLFNHAAEEACRLVAVGSLYGTRQPVLALSAYSLGKAALEETARLLAPELARRGITVNVVCPSFVALGMNRQAPDRQLMKERAAVPMGRLCEASDIAGAVRYLFSPAASFVSGQVIWLTGGRL